MTTNDNDALAAAAGMGIPVADAPTTHTPGPWISYGYHITQPEGYYPIATLNQNLEIGEIEANARLIATAPEMLDELKKQQEWLRHIKPQVKAPESVMMGFDQSIKYISALIDRAEGRT